MTPARSVFVLVMGAMVRVTVWGENVHESRQPERCARSTPTACTVRSRPAWKQLGAAAEVRTVTLDDPEHGLTEEVLADTDVLTWWGHMAHEKVDDAIVDRVQHHVLGAWASRLHSAHYSKIFRRLIGTSCCLRWRNDGERELVWTVRPGHPIADGVPHPLVIDEQEMYGEWFDIPQPDEFVFISSFAGGEVFRSGCIFHRGKGRIFYFCPGDQEYPVYHHKDSRCWPTPSGGPRRAPAAPCRRRPTRRATASSEVPTCAICGEEHPPAEMVTLHNEPEDVPAGRPRASFPAPRDWWLADAEAAPRAAPRARSSSCHTAAAGRCVPVSRSGWDSITGRTPIARARVTASGCGSRSSTSATTATRTAA